MTALRRISGRIGFSETNLDSRVRGNDESREKNVPRETPPFSFIGVRCIGSDRRNIVI